MSDHLTPYREAYEQTSEALHRTESLARALYDLALSHTERGSSDPPAEAIVSLIVGIEEKAKLAAARHEAEWGLIVKPGSAGREAQPDA